MKLFTKKELIEEISQIMRSGWQPSVKSTRDCRNDGAVGNTLEQLLGIKENNLPVPNAVDWELKGQRSQSKALMTLKHIEPSPTALSIVSNILLPLYGWKHAEAGRKYPANEKSFRSTTSAVSFTNRGFKIIIDREQKKMRFVFDSSKADRNNPKIAEWLAGVAGRAGLGALDPEPYWGFDDLKYQIGSKIRNCFYVIAETKIVKNHEFFRYESLLILTGFSFDRFLDAADTGKVFVDFDARTGHNHGTKFRVKQEDFPSLYDSVEKII